MKEKSKQKTEVQELFEFIREHMPLKSEVAMKDDLARFATKDDLVAIKSDIVAMKSDIVAMKSDLTEQIEDVKRFVTDKLEQNKEEIIDRLTPTEKAVDKDVVMVLDHERRIRIIEKQYARA